MAASPPINLSLWGTTTMGVPQKIPVLSSSVHFLLRQSKECPLGLSGESRQMKSSLISLTNPPNLSLISAKVVLAILPYLP